MIIAVEKNTKPVGESLDAAMRKVMIVWRRYERRGLLANVNV